MFERHVMFGSDVCERCVRVMFVRDVCVGYLCVCVMFVCDV